MIDGFKCEHWFHSFQIELANKVIQFKESYYLPDNKELAEYLGISEAKIENLLNSTWSGRLEDLIRIITRLGLKLKLESI